MTEIFLKLLNMSLAAGWLVIAVVLIRPFLKKTPRWVSCLLWGIVGLRLIVPFFVESTFSLIPSAEVVPQDIATTQTPAIHSGIPAVNSAVNPLFTQNPVQHENVLPELLSVATVVWLIGVGILLIYSVVMYWKLRHQVRASVLLRDNIYVCDEVPSPFILGVFSPKIYIPSGMDETCLAHVLVHEKVHIQRKDHWWKPIGFALLTVYWYHPLLWLAYILLCRDIEQACDEKVISSMDTAGKKGYSEALVACSMHRRMIMACPVAFGEVGVKARIKGIVNYKKPGFWILIISVLVCVIIAVCFLTNPKTCDHTYESKVRTKATCTEQGVMEYTCSRCQHCYTQPFTAIEHTYEFVKIEKTSTCTEEGLQLNRCTACGTEERIAIEKIPHTLENATVMKEPNCTQEGEACGDCTVCGGQQVMAAVATNDVHVFTDIVIKEATCTEKGEGVHVCALCEYQEPCQYELKEHTYSNINILRATSCTQDGEQECTCVVCGYYTKETVPAFGHSWTGATCQTAAICATCGATGSKSGHNYATAEVCEPSSMFAGYVLKQCTTCTAQKKEYYTMNHWFNLDAIAATIASDARSKGFKTSIEALDSGDRSVRLSVVSLENPGGGTDMMYSFSRRFILELRDEVIAEGRSPDECTMHICVTYGESSVTGGVFRITLKISYND